MKINVIFGFYVESNIFLHYTIFEILTLKKIGSRYRQVFAWLLKNNSMAFACLSSSGTETALSCSHDQRRFEQT